MRRLTLLSVLAPLAFAGTPVAAGWRAPISGGEPVLPPRFVPMRFEVAPSSQAAPLAGWSFPLVDRALSQAEKAEPLAPELTEAISRIEPMYDPTRLDGTGMAPPLHVSAGTAAMNNVFADRWRRADPDANVDLEVPAIALAWQDRGPRPCAAFTKAHAHGWGDPELTGLSPGECAALLRAQATGLGDAPAPVVVAWIGVPVFAAPLPGSRMTSAAFWAARRARIAEVQARLRHKWQAGGMPLAEAER